MTSRGGFTSHGESRHPQGLAVMRQMLCQSVRLCHGAEQSGWRGCVAGASHSLQNSRATRGTTIVWCGGDMKDLSRQAATSPGYASTTTRHPPQVPHQATHQRQHDIGPKCPEHVEVCNQCPKVAGSDLVVLVPCLQQRRQKAGASSWMNTAEGAQPARTASTDTSGVPGTHALF